MQNPRSGTCPRRNRSLMVPEWHEILLHMRHPNHMRRKAMPVLLFPDAHDPGEWHHAQAEGKGSAQVLGVDDMTAMPTCSNICQKYGRKKHTGKKPNDWFPASDDKYCRGCETYIKYDGVYCPCCSRKLRNHSRWAHSRRHDHKRY